MKRSRSILAAAAATLVFGQAAQAAPCLDPALREAARLHQFETLVMTVALRCKPHGVDVEASLSRMMAVHAAYFGAADRLVRGYLDGGHNGGRAGATAHAFDAYATRVANRYGGGASNPLACQAVDETVRAVIADPGGATLHRVASAMVAESEMERQACRGAALATLVAPRKP